MSANSFWCLVILVDSESSDSWFSELQVGGGGSRQMLSVESSGREKRTREPVSPFTSGGAVLLRRSSADSAVLQHDGRQALLHVLHRPLSPLVGGVELRQQQRHVKVQDVRLGSSASAVHLRLLRCRSGVGGREVAGVSPPALVQTVVVDQRLQALGSGFSFFFSSF